MSGAWRGNKLLRRGVILRPPKLCGVALGAERESSLAGMNVSKLALFQQNDLSEWSALKKNNNKSGRSFSLLLESKHVGYGAFAPYFKKWRKTWRRSSVQECLSQDEEKKEMLRKTASRILGRCYRGKDVGVSFKPLVFTHTHRKRTKSFYLHS